MDRRAGLDKEEWVTDPKAWNGSVVRLGKEASVATPLHEFIYHGLLPLELQARGEVRFPE